MSSGIWRPFCLGFNMFTVMWRHCNTGGDGTGSGPPECFADIPPPIKDLVHSLISTVGDVVAANIDIISSHHDSLEAAMGSEMNIDDIDYEDVVAFVESGPPIDDEDIPEFVEGLREAMGDIVADFITTNLDFIRQHSELMEEANGEGEDVMSWTCFPHYWTFMRGTTRQRWIYNTKKR